MTRSKVLIVHIPYEHRGGEDVHVDMLVEAYQQMGMTPVLYPEERHPRRHTLQEAGRSLLGNTVPHDLLKLFSQTQPSFIHSHNIFPTLGPAFLRWILENRIPLLTTIHNHRFYCSNGLAIREGAVCKDCLGARIGWRPLLRNCNGSQTKSTYHAAALTEIGLGELYSRAVTKFIAPSPYIREELLRYGVAEKQISWITSPVFPIEQPNTNSLNADFDIFYAGRLSREKGIVQLLAAMKYLPDVRLGIAGDGPERQRVEASAREFPNMRYFPEVSRQQVLNWISSSRLGVAPSMCNESLGFFPLECFVMGRRCIVSSEYSSQWLAQAPFFGVGSKCSDPKVLATDIRTGLALEPIKESEIQTIRQYLGMERFQRELRAAIEQMSS